MSLVVCAPLGIAAWIMGNGDLRQMDAGAMDPTGRSVTNAGRICGIIGTIFFVIAIIIIVLVFAFGLLVAGHR